ncbi:hypothetical protein Pmani_021678 [Petrolisthes manimaculis]|uniref:Uncharacterized protein n=1 Tax=Petrolisthes manimaculis TaxID=1843537 RepID=A0AAE1U2W1_9EUCA|nr:hypothetical protein Pmani_021678 [Petrolisthes manimaculis]
MAGHRELPPIPYQALLRGALIGHRPECYSFDNNCHCSSRQHYRPVGSQENYMTRMSSEEVIRSYSSLPTKPTLPTFSPTSNVARNTGVHGAPYGHGAHTMPNHTTVPNGSIPPYTHSGHGTTITHQQPPHMMQNGGNGQVQYGYPNRPSVPVAGNMQEAITRPTLPSTNQQNHQQHRYGGPSEVAKQQQLQQQQQQLLLLRQQQQQQLLLKQQQQQLQQQKAAMTVTQPTVPQGVMNIQQPHTQHQQANIMRHPMQSGESRPTLSAGGLTVQQADMIRASQDQAAMIRAKQNQAAMMMQANQNQTDIIRPSQDQAAMIRAKQNQAVMMMQAKQNQAAMMQTSKDQAAMMQAKQNQAAMIQGSQDQYAMLMQAKQNQADMIRAKQNQAAMIMQAKQNQAAMIIQAKNQANIVKSMQ